MKARTVTRMNEITENRKYLARVCAKVITGRITANDLYTTFMTNGEKNDDGTVRSVQYWAQDDRATLVFQAAKDTDKAVLFVSVAPDTRSGVKEEWARLSSPRASALAQELIWYAESKL